jgi:hypothetical protein
LFIIKIKTILDARAHPEYGLLIRCDIGARENAVFFGEV